MTKFRDMPWEERIYLIRPALALVLETLTYPASTTLVGERIMRQLNIPTAEKAVVSQVLTGLARTCPHATHDGGPIRTYGKEGTRWRWHRIPPGGEASWAVEGAVDPLPAPANGHSEPLDQVAEVFGWLEDRQAEARVLGEDWEVTAIGRLKDRWLEDHQ